MTHLLDTVILKILAIVLRQPAPCTKSGAERGMQFRGEPLESVVKSIGVHRVDSLPDPSDFGRELCDARIHGRTRNSDVINVEGVKRPAEEPRMDSLGVSIAIFLMERGDQAAPYVIISRVQHDRRECLLMCPGGTVPL